MQTLEVETPDSFTIKKLRPREYKIVVFFPNNRTIEGLLKHETFGSGKGVPKLVCKSESGEVHTFFKNYAQEINAAILRLVFDENAKEEHVGLIGKREWIVNEAKRNGINRY